MQQQVTALAKMLSRRALANIQPNDIKSIMAKGSSNAYDAQTNPSGMISLGVAENRLMHDEIAAHISSHLSITKRCLTYGDGSVGSDQLRQSIASLMNKTAFRPRKHVEMKHVTVLSGVSSIIDCLAFSLCEAGEAVLLGRPTYVGFISDLVSRAGVKPVLVDFERRSQPVHPMSLEAVECYENALIESTQNGTLVRALLLCHPHNPFGVCYEPRVLEAYLSLCAKHRIHFISDEVYANSLFASTDYPSPPVFTSVLALEIKKYIDPSMVHCLYGMSKDFCSNGIRLGALISQDNHDLHAAIRAISKFAWPSSLADAAWCGILTDELFLQTYFQTLTQRLSAAYEHCIALLKRHGIPYVPAHAGPFIWIDLSTHLSSPSVEAERELAWKMIENKVWLATGEAYRSERPGWFRITFAVDKAELELGIERVMKSLKRS
ncbi:1-aminocyclopropane-1-carboxylate synthase [Trichoderma longibrachiatum]|uniref:1-aminocyclopropane-1-carboxylate synthase n=1 Tax=Trichoderma longibrachiatum ATCC 18648 TaxID=983965 RepID=A0A2T4BR27_TRILO|nr:1-aminocyclopropane-1-carboxylate synthase [Trichoderma longibrachiatum ATCC 18648]